MVVQLQVDPLAGALGFLSLGVTAYIAVVARNYTRKSEELQHLKSSVELIHAFDIAVLSDEANVQAVSELRPPPPNLSKRQEHLLCLYLNHLELTYRMCSKKMLSREVLDTFVQDGIEYYKGRRDALVTMLGYGYEVNFRRYMLEQYDRTAVRGGGA